MFNRDEYDFFLKDDYCEEEDGDGVANAPKAPSATPDDAHSVGKQADRAIRVARDLLQKKWDRDAATIRN